MQDIRQASEIRGENLWVLVFAILIASLGLNTNSTSAIIGAMLISPLMGPIMAIGVGAAINDSVLVRQSGRTLIFAVFTAIFTSTIYFIISPLNNAHSELLARTMPTTYDLLVAFIGGLAGIIAVSREIKSANIIAGVAIATALMPPLCTVGYGIAHLDLHFFLGAFYLFTINCVYICLASFIVTRFLKFSKAASADGSTNVKTRRIFSILATATLLPSLYIAYHLVKVEITETQINNFIEHEISSNPEIQVLKHSFDLQGNPPQLQVTLLTRLNSADLEKKIRPKLLHYGLDKFSLKLHSNLTEASPDLSALKTGVIEELFKKNETTIQTLQTELEHYKARTLPTEDIIRELSIEHPAAHRAVLALKGADLIGFIETSHPLNHVEKQKIQDWLLVRTKAENVQILFKTTRRIQNNP